MYDVKGYFISRRSERIVYHINKNYHNESNRDHYCRPFTRVPGFIYSLNLQDGISSKDHAYYTKYEHLCFFHVRLDCLNSFFSFSFNFNLVSNL